MYDNASELYNDYLEVYFDTFSEIKKRKLGNKYDPTNLFHETYNYETWFQNKESSDTKTKSDLLSMPALEDMKN